MPAIAITILILWHLYIGVIVTVLLVKSHKAKSAQTGVQAKLDKAYQYLMGEVE
jgi:hypothetical protein